jgi:hypothetical protein
MGMKLLELLPLMKKYGRVKRTIWENRFLIKPIDDFEPLINCDISSRIMNRYHLSFRDLTSDDWELVD